MRERKINFDFCSTRLGLIKEIFIKCYHISFDSHFFFFFNKYCIDLKSKIIYFNIKNTIFTLLIEINNLYKKIFIYVLLIYLINIIRHILFFVNK